MDNIRKANYFEKLVSFYLVALSVIYTFYYRIDIDKYVGFFIVLCAVLLLLFKKDSSKLLYKSTLDKYSFFLGTVALITVYFIQLIKFQKIVNVEVFTILSIYSTLIFYNLTKNKFNYLFLVQFFGLIMFLFLIINMIIFKDGSITIRQLGFFSFTSYLCFIIFLFFFTSNRFLLIPTAFFVLASQTRILIISLMLILMRSNILSIKNIIRGIFIVFIFLLLMYYFFPNARIFQMHTSGRVIHWEIIYYRFDFTNVLFGMGAGSSSKLLINIGVSETMARAHNEFLTYFYELGLLGIIGLFGILKLIHSSSSNKGRIVFYTIVLQMLTNNIFTYYFNYLLPLILCLLLEYDQSLKEESPSASGATEKVIKI